MIIDPSTLAYIQTVIRTADLVKIEDIAIEPNMIRGMADDQSVVMLQNHDVPTMPFGSIGISRIDVFQSRLEVVKSVDNFQLDALVDDREGFDPFVRALTMKGKGIKLDFRCANPVTVRAPKQWEDTVVYRVKITPDLISLIQRGQSAMKTEDVTLTGDGTNASFEMVETVTGDKLSYQFSNDIEWIDVTADNAPSFSFNYLARMVYTLFKSNTNGYFEITKKGMLKIVVNNLDIYALARE